LISVSERGDRCLAASVRGRGDCLTGWLIDTDRDLTFIFLSAGFIEGLAHPRRLSRFCDLAGKVRQKRRYLALGRVTASRGSESWEKLGF
jgi:hypothetical protein